MLCNLAANDDNKVLQQQLGCAGTDNLHQQPGDGCVSEEEWEAYTEASSRWTRTGTDARRRGSVCNTRAPTGASPLWHPSTRTGTGACRRGSGRRTREASGRWIRTGRDACRWMNLCNTRAPTGPRRLHVRGWPFYFIPSCSWDDFLKRRGFSDKGGRLVEKLATFQILNFGLWFVGRFSQTSRFDGGFVLLLLNFS